MRTIKFRAWDGEKMHYAVTIYNGRFIDCADANEDVFYQWHDPADQVAIMQFIELRDKNQKEIYEGDIIKIYKEPFGDEVFDIVKVWYMAPDYMLKSIAQEGSYKMDEWGYGKDMWKFEIIGNIYENPELKVGKIRT